MTVRVTTLPFPIHASRCGTELSIEFTERLELFAVLMRADCESWPGSLRPCCVVLARGLIYRACEMNVDGGSM